jgi:hypothetical protein
MSAKPSTKLSALRPPDFPAADAADFPAANFPAPNFSGAGPVPTYCFAVQAAAEPGVLPRVMGLFAKRNLVPSRWYSDVTGPQADELVIDIQVVGLTPDESDYIARCLRQQIHVQSVLTSVKDAASICRTA